jgi:hypothetical protein
LSIFGLVQIQNIKRFCFSFSGNPVAAEKKATDYYADDYYTSDDEYVDEQEKVVHRNPKFISQSTNQLVNEGETIKLPCLADKLGNQICYVIANCS